jgi:succinate dehydrogenase / fumarate reductase flavoprotein subunit
MLKIAEVVARCAIKREESRGSHTRTDHPDRDDENYLKHTLIELDDKNLNISYKPVTIGMFEPKERVY